MKKLYLNFTIRCILVVLGIVFIFPLGASAVVRRTDGVKAVRRYMKADEFYENILVTEYEDASVSHEFPNGDAIIYFKNNVVQKISSSGTIKTEYPNGEIKTQFWGSYYVPIENGNFACKNLTGITLEEYPSGVAKMRLPDGTVATQYPNGVFSILSTNGRLETRFPSGDIFTKYEDNTFLRECADGDIEIYDNKGNLQRHIKINKDNKCRIF